MRGRINEKNYKGLNVKNDTNFLKYSDWNTKTEEEMRAGLPLMQEAITEFWRLRTRGNHIFNIWGEHVGYLDPTGFKKSWFIVVFAAGEEYEELFYGTKKEALIRAREMQKENSCVEVM